MQQRSLQGHLQQLPHHIHVSHTLARTRLDHQIYQAKIGQTSKKNHLNKYDPNILTLKHFLLKSTRSNSVKQSRIREFSLCIWHGYGLEPVWVLPSNLKYIEMTLECNEMALYLFIYIYLYLFLFIYFYFLFIYYIYIFITSVCVKIRTQYTVSVCVCHIRWYTQLCCVLFLVCRIRCGGCLGGFLILGSVVAWLSRGSLLVIITLVNNG